MFCHQYVQNRLATYMLCHFVLINKCSSILNRIISRGWFFYGPLCRCFTSKTLNAFSLNSKTPSYSVLPRSLSIVDWGLAVFIRVCFICMLFCVCIHMCNLCFLCVFWVVFLQYFDTVGWVF